MLTASRPGCNDRINAVPYQKFEEFSTKFSVEPSFEHTAYTINQKPQLYEVLWFENGAYCIYAKRNGELIQLHYNELDAWKEVISALLCRYPSAMAKYIDCGSPDVIQMLTEPAFVVITKRFEMAKDIKIMEKPAQLSVQASLLCNDNHRSCESAQEK